jgi:hypothetical protein
VLLAAVPFSEGALGAGAGLGVGVDVGGVELGTLEGDVLEDVLRLSFL